MTRKRLTGLRPAEKRAWRSDLPRRLAHVPVSAGTKSRLPDRPAGRNGVQRIQKTAAPSNAGTGILLTVYRKRHGPKPTVAVLPTVEKLAECLLPEDRLSHYLKSYRGSACSVRMRPRSTSTSNRTSDRGNDHGLDNSDPCRNLHRPRDQRLPPGRVL